MGIRWADFRYCQFVFSYVRFFGEAHKSSFLLHPSRLWCGDVLTQLCSKSHYLTPASLGPWSSALRDWDPEQGSQNCPLQRYGSDLQRITRRVGERLNKQDCLLMMVDEIGQM
ncbi:unnamed protein product [Fusarium graminearum]|uniref:Chromosome 4, complete genome n=1 Tax=Gibberella zeae (strain ATCC MYA-4620 / CBS 123657 / FGSC 9075 / NRRL 31084 / PH-1) TaxID=229533 RepID=I1S9R0_GIBZE|nr:hypothetical protein FGSG_13591 [Fusarium graminearum PH-1]ESU16045.1 hypothetical protein FGSG_13591 [Fusarium graminearum PH-1]CEF85087.1 unnamed protein product [Fusarium graminearum]CZS74433.1 unnamed protein product [Fusarium graminearum]|eukprot:XP_011328271.1 hypothetical protein FGSG_13591 [Fusarium graminearum PH-1]